MSAPLAIRQRKVFNTGKNKTVGFEKRTFLFWRCASGSDQGEINMTKRKAVAAKARKLDLRGLFELSVFDRAQYFTVVELRGLPSQRCRTELPTLRDAISLAHERMEEIRVLVYAVDDRKHDFCIPKEEWPKWLEREEHNQREKQNPANL